MCFLVTGHFGNVLLTREAVSLVTAVFVGRPVGLALCPVIGTCEQEWVGDGARQAQ